MADARREIIRELWAEFFELVPLTQHQISILRKDGLSELESLNKRAEMVRSKLRLLQVSCKHPQMGALHVCPDCGFDNE